MKIKLQKRHGVALIIVLSVLFLISGLILAYVTRSELQRRVSFSSSGQRRAEHLAATAVQLVIGDLRKEIEAGSDLFATSGTRVFIPKELPNGAAMRPSKSLPGFSPDTPAPASLCKISKYGLPQWSLSAAGTSTITRASSVSTATPSKDGRFLPPKRWEKPQLGVTFSGSTAPDWIYVTGSGVPENASSLPSVSDLANQDANNANRVLGRYSYVVYDTGGLVDLQVLGHFSTGSEAPDANDKMLRGNRAFIDLTKLTPDGASPLTAEQVDELIRWRWHGARGSFPGSDFREKFMKIEAPKEGFLKLREGDQRFLGRSDLIKFWISRGWDQKLLPFVGFFNRELNKPHYHVSPVEVRPPSTAAKPIVGYPNDSNPVPHKIRRPSYGVINTRPGLVLLEKNIPVKEGDPLLRRRFPLKRLEWIGKNGPANGASEADVHLAFGLQWDAPQLRWSYTGADQALGNLIPAKSIRTLEEVAKLNPPRDPDFFELLKAGILDGSLGKTLVKKVAKERDDPSKRVAAVDQAFSTSVADPSVDLHLVRIGANIIDQADSDSIPTSIALQLQTAAGWIDERDIAVGIENIPYIWRVSPTVWRPGINHNDPGLPRIGGWIIFNVWNPHQGAATPSPNAPTEFRIRGEGLIRTEIFENFPTPNLAPPAFIPLGTQPISFSRATAEKFSESTWLRPPFASSSPDQAFNIPESIPGNPGFVGLFCGIFNIPDSRLTGNSGHRRTTHYSFGIATGRDRPRYVLEVWNKDDGTWRPAQSLRHQQSDLNEEPFRSDPARLSFQSLTPWQTNFLSDPRTSRFGGVWSQDVRGLQHTPWADTSKPGTLVPGAALNGKAHSREPAPPHDSWTVERFDWVRLSHLVWNHESRIPSLGKAATTYRDADWVLRPGDGYLGTQPMALTSVPDPHATSAIHLTPADPQARPIVLDRPFRSVAELGYAFRDLPWKTLDFFSDRSADGALLELFSVADEAEVLAGGVNLNSAPQPVLQMLFDGMLRDPWNTSGGTISSASAKRMAEAFITAREKRLLSSRADLPRIIADPDFASAAFASGHKYKPQREVVARALADVGQVRTWNLMIDLIAQSGRLVAGASTLADFRVEGERRFWIHLALDRITGEVIDSIVEPVYE